MHTNRALGDGLISNKNKKCDFRINNIMLYKTLVSTVSRAVPKAETLIIKQRITVNAIIDI